MPAGYAILRAVNDVPPQFPGKSPLRSFLCIAAYGMMLMLGILILSSGLGMAVTGWKLYGWLLRGEPEFAEHWNESQKRAFTSLEQAIRYDNSCFTDYTSLFRGSDMDEDADYKSLSWAVKRDTHTMPHAKKADDSLRELVKLSREEAAKHPSLQTLAFAAAEMGQWAAMQILVELGMPASTKNEHDETLLSVVLSNMTSRPQAEVFEVAEWLLAHGAEITPGVALYESVALANDGQEEATLEWLLAHGLTLDIWKNGEQTFLPLEVCMQNSVALPVFERLVKEGRLKVNERRGSATYLQRAAMNEQLQAVELLLKLGADVSAVSESPAATLEKYTPVDILLYHLSEHIQGSEAEKTLSALRLLLQHGAVPGEVLPELDKWEDKALQQQVEALLREFGFSLPSSTPSSST